MLCPFSRREKGRLVDPRAPGHLGQGESRRLAGALDLLSEQAQLAMLAAGVDSRVTIVFRAEDIPDTRRPGYDGLKEDLP
jgi:hypothetical protein